jgi:A/G-specific adenine glycosylase
LEKVWDLEELGRLRSALLYWYDVEARQLPWRQRNGRPDPYQVYVSEVMLQQTRVSTVKTYFKHWMERFPTVQALAAASEEDVLQQWAGLGYYRRARMLHAGARWLVTHHGGELPTSVQELTQVPGIGEYTAGAIASIAFGQCVPAVDGNAIRVLSRLAGLDAMNVWKGAGKRYLMTLASALVDPERPGDWNQAIFDLGSAVCIPQLTEHACGSCPLRTFCKAAHLPVEAIQRIPYLRTTTQGDAPKIQRQMPRARVRRELVHAFVLVANDLDAKQGHPHDPVYFVRRRAANGLLGGLWEVPNLVVERFDVGASTQAEDSELSISLASRPPLERESCDAFERLAEALASPTLPSSAIRSMTLVPERVRHLFTHIRQDILVFRVEVSAPSLFLDQTRNGQWVSATSLREMGLSTQMRKVLRAASVSLPRKRFAETSLTDECENAQP